MALKFAMLLELVDRASAPARRARTSMQQLTAGARRMATSIRQQKRDVDSGARSLEHYERRARRLRSVALGRTFQAAADSARRLSRNVRDIPARLRLIERSGQAAGRGLKWLGGRAMGMLGGAAQIAGGAALAGSGFALFDMFRTAGQFEQYQIMLEGMFGSAAKGQKAFSWIKKFAKDTPFELDQVTQAFLILKNAGLDPMNGSLMAAGDAGAGMAKDITQAAEAMADAMTGEFERLKDLGITASTAGDQVTLSWVKNEKQFTKVANKADRVGLAMAVAAAWQDKFAGSQERQSKSLFGIISNLKDLWSDFLVMVANAGIFDRVKGKLDEWRARLDRMAKSGELQRWAERISERLNQAWDWGVKFVEKTNWEAVGQGLATGISALTKIVELLGQAAEKYNQFLRWKAMNSAQQSEQIEGSLFSSRSAKSAARLRRRTLENDYGFKTETRKGEDARDNAMRRSRWQRSINNVVGRANSKDPAIRVFGRTDRVGQPQKISLNGSAAIKVDLNPHLIGRIDRVEKKVGDIALNVSVGRTMRSSG